MSLASRTSNSAPSLRALSAHEAHPTASKAAFAPQPSPSTTTSLHKMAPQPTIADDFDDDTDVSRCLEDAYSDPPER